MLTPPERVWHAIRDEVGMSAPTPQPGRRRRPPVDPRSRGTPVGVAAPVLATAWVLAASLVVVAGVAVGGWAIGQRTAVVRGGRGIPRRIPRPPWSRGRRSVGRDAGRSRMVRVELEADEAPDSYREVWLITKDASALVSLGVLDGTEGTFTVPERSMCREYVLVDVSNEPDDGEPGHSGDSIVRGELGFL